jgi:hypothetical protein
MVKKTAKKTTQQGNRIWIIKKNDFQNALDILEQALGDPLSSPKGVAREPLKSKHQKRTQE